MGTAAGTSPMAALRDATAAAHLSVESAWHRRAPAASREAYAAYLRDMRAFHAVFEPAAEAAALRAGREAGALALFERRKLALLDADLASLGVSVPPGTPALVLPALSTWAQLLGALYVVEGSTLGGRTVARLVADGLGGDAPRAYLLAYGPDTGRRWRELAAVVDALPRDELPGAIDAARQTFACIERCLDAPAP